MKRQDSTDVVMAATAEWAIANAEWLQFGAMVEAERKKRRVVVTAHKGVMFWTFEIERFRTADRDEVELIETVVADRLDHIRQLSDALGPVVGWDGAWDGD